MTWFLSGQWLDPRTANSLVNPALPPSCGTVPLLVTRVDISIFHCTKEPIHSETAQQALKEDDAGQKGPEFSIHLSNQACGSGVLLSQYRHLTLHGSQTRAHQPQTDQGTRWAPCCSTHGPAATPERQERWRSTRDAFSSQCRQSLMYTTAGKALSTTKARTANSEVFALSVNRSGCKGKREIHGKGKRGVF